MHNHPKWKLLISATQKKHWQILSQKHNTHLTWSPLPNIMKLLCVHFWSNFVYFEAQSGYNCPKVWNLKFFMMFFWYIQHYPGPKHNKKDHWMQNLWTIPVRDFQITCTMQSVQVIYFSLVLSRIIPKYIILGHRKRVTFVYLDNDINSYIHLFWRLVFTKAALSL